MQVTPSAPAALLPTPGVVYSRVAWLATLRTLVNMHRGPGSTSIPVLNTESLHTSISALMLSYTTPLEMPAESTDVVFKDLFSIVQRPVPMLSYIRLSRSDYLLAGP